MANIFGTERVKIIIDNNEFTFPKTSRGGREEDFIADKKIWIDLNKKLQERIKGYRLKAIYRYEILDSGEFEDLVNAYNSSKILFLKFDTVPRYFPVIITNFRHGLAGGLNTNDECEIEFTGTQLTKRYPNPDEFYASFYMLGTGLITRTLLEQQ